MSLGGGVKRGIITRLDVEGTQRRAHMWYAGLPTEVIFTVPAGKEDIIKVGASIGVLEEELNSNSVTVVESCAGSLKVYVRKGKTPHPSVRVVTSIVLPPEDEEEYARLAFSPDFGLVADLAHLKLKVSSGGPVEPNVAYEAFVERFPYDEVYEKLSTRWNTVWLVPAQQLKITDEKKNDEIVFSAPWIAWNKDEEIDDDNWEPVEEGTATGDGAAQLENAKTELEVPESDREASESDAVARGGGEVSEPSSFDYEGRLLESVRRLLSEPRMAEHARNKYSKELAVIEKKLLSRFKPLEAIESSDLENATAQ